MRDRSNDPSHHEWTLHIDATLLSINIILLYLMFILSYALCLIRMLNTDLETGSKSPGSSLFNIYDLNSVIKLMRVKC